MCGIAGLCRFRGQGDDRDTVARMLAKLVHRGPDDEGIEVFPRVVLGNRRLAILDLSQAAHQPMQDAKSRFVVTFNGELYNYAEVRDELGIDPAELRSSGDTEVLLRAWERWGAAALDHFVGQWAFAIYDKADSTLILARDRMGEKPLYYHADADRLVFASSLGSLLQAPGTPRELDPSSLAEYVALRYVVSPRTVLRDARKLPPGTWMKVGPDGELETHAWYVPRFSRAGKRRREGERVEEFDSLFSQACKRCLVSDVPVALLLSDGIDSNAIRASLSRDRHSPPSFTYRVSGDDGETAPAAAEGPGGPVFDLEVSDRQRLEALDTSLPLLTEPVGDGAALATWMLIHAARPQAKVFLCGHGGDEVLGGYRLSQDRFRLAALRALAPVSGRWLGATYDRFLYGDESLAARVRELRRRPSAEAPAAARYLIHRPLPARDVRSLMGSLLPAGKTYLEVVDRLYGRCAPEAKDLDRMQEVMLPTFLTEDILSFADSVAMSCSAELRMPFLDRDLVAFALSLRPDERVGSVPGRTNTKRILRAWARGRLPTSVIRRRKRSFRFGALPELLRLHGNTLRERVLDASAVRRALPGVEPWLDRAPETFRGPWEGTYWALLSLAAWCLSSGVNLV